MTNSEKQGKHEEHAYPPVGFQSLPDFHQLPWHPPLVPVAQHVIDLPLQVPVKATFGHFQAGIHVSPSMSGLQNPQVVLHGAN